MPRCGKHSVAVIVLAAALAASAAGRAAEPAPTTLPPPTPVPGPPPAAAPLFRMPKLPPWLPRYDLDIHLDVHGHRAVVRQRVAWFNRSKTPTNELVFNAHSHYVVPKKEIGLLAKTLELLRITPSEALYSGEAPLQVYRARLGDQEVPYHYQADNDTALVVSLPRPVAPGEWVTLDLEFTLHLPEKWGRWGHWNGVTYLSNWVPVLAPHDDRGWHPTPFIPWHQPFFNDAGMYTVRVTLPCDQKVACSGSIVGQKELGEGMKQVEIVAPGVRDFAFLCSALYQEFTGEVPASPGVAPVRVKCLALPEHSYYAKRFVKHACEVIPVYSRWFGPYPYGEFTFAESYFGWNGNECSTLVMIDERVFNMPHLSRNYAEYLIVHEVCHQWWYNLIGTNGYCETWMDEAFANYFAHRFLNEKYGTCANPLLQYKPGLEWMPNIPRNSYRMYGLYGALGRGDQCPIVQDMPKFGHVANLFAMCYDKGGKVLGMIEDRLGEAAFLDFIRRIYCRYAYDIIRIADFQRELEEYTGRSWEEFFHNWLHGAGMTDWCVEKVEVNPIHDKLAQVQSTFSKGNYHYDIRNQGWAPGFLEKLRSYCYKDDGPCKVVVWLKQKAEYCEQTVLGFRLKEGDGWQRRVPILPQAEHLKLDDHEAVIDTMPDGKVRVEVTLPCRPLQIAVDPDQVVPDKEPANNFWRPECRFRWTPLYTFLDDTDLTTAYDRCNVTAGPWLFLATSPDPWYTRTTMAGVRAGVYRTQQFNGGVYAAYRTTYRDVVAGMDGLVDHWPFCHTQVGFNAEHRLLEVYEGETGASRASAFARYVITYGSSLYLPPIHYVEAYGEYTDNFLPFARRNVPGADRYDNLTAGGLHWRLNYLTPYWDAEGGFRADASYQAGTVELDREGEKPLHMGSFQLSWVKCAPDLCGWAPSWLDGPAQWLASTRFAFRVYGAAASPMRGEFYSLGGNEMFRGYDLRERQGNLVWLGSAEWRVPLAKRLHWDYLDNCIGVRNLYAVAFWDVGDAYVAGQSMGPVAHAVGGGLRLDVSLLSFLERTVVGFDAAKTVNDNTPWQFLLRLQHAF